MTTIKTTVLIVDDHPVTRAGIRSILEDNETIEIIGQKIGIMLLFCLMSIAMYNDLLRLVS